MTIQFTGFDSAWGGRAKGAICDLDGQVSDGRLTLRIKQKPIAVTWAEACAHLQNYQDLQDHVVAIDQGLVVPNPTGMRPVERSLAAALMGTYKCGAHASNYGAKKNQKENTCYGPKAGIWDFLDELNRRDYRQDPMAVAEKQTGRFYFECYPHPALIGLFRLETALRYKKTNGTQTSWNELCELMRGLKNRDLPIENVDEFVSPQLNWTKANEDALDSLIAAYVAAYFWWFGTETKQSVVLGSLTTGYIVTPCEGVLEKYEKAFGDQINPYGRATSVRPPTDQIGQTIHPEVTATAVDTQEVTASDQLVELHVKDTGNIYAQDGNQSWMDPARCVGWRLFLTFVDLDGEPTLNFVPFKNDGDKQRGMKPEDGDTRLEWKFIAEGASKRDPIAYRVRYTYEPELDTKAAS